ncbi:pentapeptide repeat-containing protein [Micrococcus endophyticus]|uniref:pentapeptide repeat-containing protein n=1 Tax=Micrococcus endophyticus TaxID=455343 RepID=UPI0034CFA069
MTDGPITPPHPKGGMVPAQPAAKPERGRVKHPRLWGVLGWAATAVILGLIVAAVLTIVLWLMFRGVWPWHDSDRLKVEGIDLLKLALSVVAGAGGAVALTVSVLKQRILERDAEGQRAEAAAQREVDAAFRSRYGEAATQLGSDRAAVQLAGVYAMANLADDWPEQRQQCVDVLCGFLRLPPPADEALRAADAKIRTTIGAVLRDHLQEGGAWCGLDFNLIGAYLVDLNLIGARFTGRNTFFTGAQFTGEVTSFAEARFASERTSFVEARFTGEVTWFVGAEFTGENTSFVWAEFTGKTTSFAEARFTGENTWFDEAEFTGENTWFDEARFTGKTTSFAEARFTGEHTTFDEARFTGEHTSFDEARFTGENTSFDEARFTGKTTSFDEAQFTGNRERVFKGAVVPQNALNGAHFAVEP